jgi:hypothetical protein
MIQCGVHGASRTRNLRLRTPPLCSIELRGQAHEKKLVLSAGLEPAPSRSRNPALFQLSYESVELRAGLEPACARFAGEAVAVPVTAT